MQPPWGSPLGGQKAPLGLKIQIFKDIKSNVVIQAAEWILSHMLEISHARDFNRAPRRPSAGPEGALRGTKGPQKILGRLLGVVKMNPLSQKNIVFQYKMLKDGRLQRHMVESFGAQRPLGVT